MLSKAVFGVYTLEKKLSSPPPKTAAAAFNL
jgi:hypothetical protein